MPNISILLSSLMKTNSEDLRKANFAYVGFIAKISIFEGDKKGSSLAYVSQTCRKCDGWGKGSLAGLAQKLSAKGMA